VGRRVGAHEADAERIHVSLLRRSLVHGLIHL
jgi:hypothetical protein